MKPSGEFIDLRGTEKDAHLIHEPQERFRTEKELVTYHDKLRSMSSELLLTGERERHRISADFHERIGNALAIVRIKLGSLMESAVSPEQKKAAGDIEALVQQAIQDMRSLLFELSPPILYELGLDEAIEWYAEKIHKQYGIIVHFISDGSPKPLEAGFRVLIFHAARELLFNIAKHSRASQAKVTIRKDAERLRIDVMDDGIGFDPSGIDTRDKRVSGLGLFTLRECLESLGGSLDVQSKIGMGTRITLLAPLKTDAESEDPEKTCPL